MLSICMFIYTNIYTHIFFIPSLALVTSSHDQYFRIFLRKHDNNCSEAPWKILKGEPVSLASCRR